MATSIEQLINGFWGVVGVAMLGAVLFTAGKTRYELDRDLDALMERAQVAASASDMRGYMEQLEANMQKHHATSGHMAFVFTTPRTDLALQHQGVLRVIERLTELERLPHDSQAYQSGLDDLRGVIREMPRMAAGVWWVSYGGLRSYLNSPQRARRSGDAIRPAVVPRGATPVPASADREDLAWAHAV